MRPTWLLLLVVAGCSSRTGSRADTPTPASAAEAATVPVALDVGGPAATPAAPPTPTPDPPPVDAASAGDPRCDELHRALVAALAALPSPCTADSDCVCYNGGIEGFTDCGGVSDRATSDRIYRVVEGYRALEVQEVFCPHGLSVDCAPRMCETACVGGICREGAGSADRPTLEGLEP